WIARRVRGPLVRADIVWIVANAGSAGLVGAGGVVVDGAGLIRSGRHGGVRLSRTGVGGAAGGSAATHGRGLACARSCCAGSGSAATGSSSASTLAEGGEAHRECQCNRNGK